MGMGNLTRNSFQNTLRTYTCAIIFFTWGREWNMRNFWDWDEISQNVNSTFFFSEVRTTQTNLNYLFSPIHWKTKKLLLLLTINRFLYSYKTSQLFSKTYDHYK